MLNEINEFKIALIFLVLFTLPDNLNKIDKKVGGTCSQDCLILTYLNPKLSKSTEWSKVIRQLGELLEKSNLWFV